ncbi:MAG: [NiFe]-hydrogenase assembly chaperone HybE [Hydrogenophaga sp.]|uniref:[NiFe]-hydrogenase assembly chaperone HybE n=1 Tax=Hydrogenophaga sp. TaxID=1904254 RepID=UPI001D7C49FE|nr:[NiFe]-hydrogenase assembly chaperone HybE [Hydrogenophaga sp.]MBX3609050.1 [NiFe]-hydrogenase assembly chaperone HybE [Hydrogenophaga sp.]
MNTLVNPPADAARLATRVDALVAFYLRVQRERMQDVPLLHPGLQVQAVGFEWAAVVDQGPDAGEARVAEGVLITPWFMSLVRLPEPVLDLPARVGLKVTRDFGCERFDFLGAHDAAPGYHETCALFSPMGRFASQAAAVDTAREALALTRPRASAAPSAPAVPSRRAFLAGRPSAVAR